jgi:hypothetical protein
VQIRRHGGQLSRRGDSELQFVLENQALHDMLLARMPASHRRAAERHRVRGLGTQVFHAAVRRAIRGEMLTAGRLLSTLHARRELTPVALAWAGGLPARIRRRVA